MEIHHDVKTASPGRLRRLPAVLAAVICLILIAIVARLWYDAREARREIEKISPRIAIVDYYGLRAVSKEQVRAQLALKVGDLAPVRIGPCVMNSIRKIMWRLDGSAARTDTEDAARPLERISGVVRAYVTTIENTGGHGTTLFVGIEEKGAPHFDYRSVPTGAVALPRQMTEAYDQFTQALPTAVANGADEDDSQGYALLKDAAILPLEQRMVAFAASDTGTLRDVLKNSADASQRNAAAWIIGYAPDKRVILGDLIRAIRDPDDGVRNNATRAIAVIGEFSGDRPELGIHIDPSPFVDMLNSLVWTDRNKATAVLLALTEKPAPAILASLHARALPSLTEMARWRDVHYQDALQLLGRIAGLDEKEIQAVPDRAESDSGERERIIAMATASTNSSASDSHPGR